MPALSPAQREHPTDTDLLRFLQRLLHLLKKYRSLIILFIAGGILTGLLAAKLLPVQYQSRCIYRSSYLTNAEQVQIVEGWNDLAKRHEYKTLATIFQQPEAVIKKLTAFEAGEVQKFFTPNNPNGFYIDAKVTDNAILPSLQEGITFGLNNSTYIKKRVASRKENLGQLTEECQEEISRLDSTKKNIELMIAQGNSNNLPVVVDIAGINKQMVELNEKLLDYKEQLKFMQGVQLLQDFIPLNTPVSLGWKTLSALGLLLGIFLSIAVIGIKEIRLQLRQIL